MSTFRGYDVERINGRYVFSDTKKPTVSTWEDRPCGHCGLFNTEEGHDGCLGTLPNVMNACCGHGNTNEAYVQFSDGSITRKEEALLWVSILNKRSDKHWYN